MFYIGKQYTGEDLTDIAIEHRAICITLLKSTLIGQVFFPLLVAIAFWGFLNHYFLIGWTLFYILSAIAMWFTLYHWYPNTDITDKHSLIDKIILSWATIVSIALMVPMFLFSPNEYPEQAIFFYIITFGTLAGALGLGGYWPIFFIMYSGVSTTAFIIHALISYYEPNYFLVIGVLVFSPFLIHIILTFNRQSAASVVLKKRYAELAKVNEQQKHQAEHMAESRKRLLASTSHDLRQPLQAMNFFLASLQKEDEFKNHTIVDRLQDSLDGVNDLLSHILELSRLEAEELKPKINAAFLPDITNKLKVEFQEQAKEKNVQINTEGPSFYVLTDAVLLTRILSNLLSNAVKYTQSGAIHIRCEKIDVSVISLSIIDTGIGIEESHHNRVFEEFVQINNPERDRRKGIGLGLSIVKRLTQLLDIKLTFKSEPDRGTTVSLKLPIAGDQDIVALQKTHLENNSADISSDENGDTLILIIDDEDAIRDSLKDLISSWGMEIIAAESVDQACLLLQKNSLKPDMIISDYRLRHNKTGVEAIEAIRTLYYDNDIPALLLSGDTNASQFDDVKAGGYQLLQKPIKAAQLRSLIQRALS